MPLEASDIAHFRATVRSDTGIQGSYVEAEQLKDRFRSLRAQRQPFFLTRAELDAIFKWKLDRQLGRVRGHLDNSDDTCQILTRAVFRICGPDADHELMMRVAILTLLHGVGVRVASAVLALIDPDHYSVIDFRAWRALFGERRQDFCIEDYGRYLHTIKQLAQELGWTPQEVDFWVMWYDTRGPQDR